MPLQEISEAELLAPQQSQQSQLQEIPEAELLAHKPTQGLVEAKELLPPEDLHAQIDRGEFSPIDYAAQLNTSGDFDKLTADQQNKLIDAYKYQRARGVTAKAVARGIEQIPTVVEQGAKGLAGIGKRVTDVFSGLGKAAAGGETKDADKSRAELGAAIESGGLNTLEFARGAIRKVAEAGKNVLGAPAAAATLGQPTSTEPSPEDIRQEFFTDLGHATQRVKAGHGQGGLAETLGNDAETLKAQGIELDPEAIENMSLLADPTNYLPAVGGFKILSKLGKQIGFVRGAAKVEEAVDKVTRGISKTAGAAASLPGRAVETLGKAAKSKAAQIAAGSGLTYSALHGDTEDLLKAAGVAIAAPFVFKHGGELLEKVGRQTASKSGTLAERVADFTLNHAVKPAAEGAIVGGTMAVPLAMLADNDDAAASLISGGMAFGAAGHAVHETARDAGQSLGGYLAEKAQTLSQRPKVESPGYGNPMDEVHSAAMKELETQRPADANVINTLREAFRNVTLPDGRQVNTEVYLVPEDIKPPELSEEQFKKARPSGFWSGITPEGKARIYLFEDATAVFHEPGHLIQNLVGLVDPTASAALDAQVRETFPEPARDAFRQAYEKRLYGDVEDRPHLSDDQVVNEIVAESFSNMLRGHSLDGLPAPFRQRIANTLGGVLEASGLYRPELKPEGTGTASPLEVAPQGTSPLGVGHSFNINQLGADFLSRLGVRVPNESIGGVVETPVRPVQKTKTLATTPIEPRKVTPEDKALKNQPPALTIEPGVDTRKWDEAEAMIKDPAELETFRSLRNAVEKPQGEVGPVRSPYFSVIEDSGQSPVERSARRMQQNIATIREELGAVPTDLREMVFKTTIPNRVLVRTRKDGSPNINILGTSVEKIFVNATLAAREAAKAGVSLPIETANGKVTPNGYRQLFDSLTKYTQNQMNGYAGDGSKVFVPENYKSDVPPANPNYTPKPLDPRSAQFVNLLQGIEPPRTTARMDRAKRFNKEGEELTTPRNVEAVRLARANQRPVLEAVNVRPANGQRPVFRESGETIKELNPLRDEFAQKGVDLSKVLHESVEELSLEHFGGAVEPVQSPLRGVSTPLATAGFMPKPGEHTEIINQMDRVSGNEMKEMTDKAEGGLTGLAYDIGLTVRDMDGLNRLKMFQEKWQKEGRRLLDEGNTTDALPAIMKAQFFREAYEAATNTGSAAGPVGFKSLRPGVEAPMENAPEVLKQKAGFMPDTRPARREIDPELEKVARNYAAGKGIEFKPSKDHALVDENRAKEVADWYDTAAHEPDSPEVQESYKAFIDETMDQYKALVDAGYKIEPWTETTGEPYHNSAEAVEDIRQNKHLWYFPTENGFGSSGIPKNHPLLADSGIVINGKHLVYNDVFRAVHDLFGHGLKGNQFGPRGEFNAWRDHSEIYSDAAKPAMSAETLAQNSWVNFGPHLRDSEGRVPGKNDPNFIPLAKRPFAEQKATILPKELLQPAKSPEEKTAHAIKEAIAPLIEALKPKEPKEAKGLESGFMPQPENPDAIKEAAVRGRGKVFTGLFHADAMEKAFDQGFPHEEYLEDGFVTNSGEFLTRHEALQRAQDIGQLPKVRPKNSVMELGMLERNEFDQHRAFMPSRNQRAIKEAAVRDEETGRIFTGPTHIQAIENANSGLTWEDRERAGGTRITEGFVTNAGEFLNREDAFRRAKELEQLPADYDPGLLQEPQLEALDFEDRRLDQHKAFMPKPRENEAPRGNLPEPEELHYTQGWLSPKGEFYSLGDLRTHDRWAANFIDEIPNLKVPKWDAGDPLSDKPVPSQVLQDNGWLRFTPQGQDGAIVDSGYGRRVTKAQKDTLETWAFSDPDLKNIYHDYVRPNGSYLAQPERLWSRDEGAFMPKSKKLAPSKDLTSKGWILPNDEFVPLGGKFHHTWLQEHANELNKKFRTNFDENTSPDERVDALNKGFTRVNYERNTGTLHVETNEKFWNKRRKDTVFETVADNLDAVDNMLVNVTDDKGKIVDTGYARLFNYDDSEKLNHLPLISEEGAFMPHKSWISPEGKVSKVIREAHEDRARIISGKQPPANSTWGDGTVFVGSDALHKDGWIRVTSSEDALMANSAKGRPLTDKQRQELTNQAIELGLNRVVFDNGNSSRTIWEKSEGDFMPKPKREQAPLGLSDVEVKPLYDREEMKTLTQPGKRNRFPEAVVPRSENDLVDYGITSSPRFKKAKTEEAAVKDFADQLVAKYDQHKDEPVVQQGRGWYSEFTPKVKELFGDKAPEFVELLAATSPRNTPKNNFAYAVEAFDNWQAGKYDGLVSKFNEGLKKLGTGALEKEYNKSVPENKRPDKPNASTWLAWWIEKHDLIPKRDNGKLFGMNSTAVLKVITRQWMSANTGMKTRQFINNLIGADHGATIDMWAARTMREIGYKDFQDRWRILSENETGVSDPDFKFSQRVFADASKRLNMKPSELQAAMWFLEKKLWQDNGWGKADYGSYQEPLRDLQVRRNAPRQTSLDIEVKPKKP